MKKKVPVVRVVRPDVAGLLPGMASETTVVLASIAESMREGLLAFTTAAGLAVFRSLLEEELTGLIGPKHAKNPDRVGNWHGTTTGQVVLGGRKISVERPRGRLVDGGGEIGSDTWDVFAADDLLQQVIVERMLAGVATRRHVLVGEPVGETLKARSVSKSAVSRRFITATETAMAELLSRDLSTLDAAVLMIDGVHFADDVLVVAMIVTADGTKIPVGLAHGDTENSTVVKRVLADLVARGLRFDDGLLVVLDGSKALRKAVNSVFGVRVVVQRCVLHKRRINRPSGSGQVVGVLGRVWLIRTRCLSRVSAVRWWRAASLVQPLVVASCSRVRMSSRWIVRVPAASGSGTKLSHCSQMLA